MDLNTAGRILLLMALGLAIVGGLMILGSRLGLGGLPGDLKLEGEGWTCFVPIATSIVLSIMLTLVLNLVVRWFR